MAPGPTFERVYRALKKQLKDGRFARGERLEPAALSADLNASVTPIRDALHRLVGERLVETPRHNGFRSPLMTEIALRDLYRWNADLLSLALRSAPRNTSPDTGPAPIEELPAVDTDVAAATAHFFTQIGRGAVHAELAPAAQGKQSADRQRISFGYRRREPSLGRLRPIAAIQRRRPMKSNHEPTRLVDLGSASEQTLGADGYSFDLVRELPIPGINHD